jgi:S-adenosylmethionine decarboxylase
MSLPNKDALGRHVLADLHGVQADVLTDPELIRTVLLRAAEAAGATPLFAKFHHFGEGQGVTGVLLLQESHISIHTWPEHGFAAVDAFMCGVCAPQVAVDVVVAAFKPVRVGVRDEVRGAGVVDWPSAA